MTITIEGHHPTIANKIITISSRLVSIQEYLLQNTKLIESMERTNNSTSTGKCFFIIKKENVSATSSFLDTEI
eukprot:2889931-Ditylum_brightwellii.AAC.1